MTIGTILLDEFNNYGYGDGTLPIRPKYDKKLLETLVQFGTVSEGGYAMLPPSLRALTSITYGEPQTPITVPEINYLSDLLIVVHGDPRHVKGKVFRFDRFEQIVRQGNISIWKRIINNDR